MRRRTTENEAPALTRLELRNLHDAIMSCGSIKAGPRFAYALAKTRRLILAEVEGVLKAEAAARAAQRELIERYADRGDDGKPITDGEGRIRIAAEHRQAYADELRAAREELEGVLAEAVRVRLHCVPWSELPEGLSAAQIDGLLPMLEGEPPADTRAA